jgi:transcription initiation factor IIE alpha subunit
MEYNKALKLKEEWGNKHCDHPKFEKLYFTGAFLLNYVCSQCGADFTVAQKLEIDEMRKKKHLGLE